MIKIFIKDLILSDIISNVFVAEGYGLHDIVNHFDVACLAICEEGGEPPNGCENCDDDLVERQHEHVKEP